MQPTLHVHTAETLEPGKRYIFQIHQRSQTQPTLADLPEIIACLAAEFIVTHGEKANFLCDMEAITLLPTAEAGIFIEEGADTFVTITDHPSLDG